MKKVFLLCIFIIFLTGCTSIKNSDLDVLVNEVVASNVNILNVNKSGYRYYLPKGFSLVSSDNYNEVITNHKYNIYLYVDIVSYNNRTNFNYNINKKAYYSRNLGNKDKKGYIEINNYEKDKYLIEIMYNYAKIEVMVFQEDIKEIVTYVMSIISSITYNDNVIKNTLSSSRLDEFEESFNIFEIVGSDNYLQFSEEVVTDDRVKDPDYVN
ncbi:MAG: hypothetical protein OSJ63_04520 [Bacilli bacterium]|jgi:hypothetical protein|uniref:hypothetical protein n=1 Tax=Romboutsia ilealis TaxID=1115758 RepID=UPI0026F39E2F|nr:hypothetical protein [Romboutsia ilealis]MCX4254516.1 hypothetical protein [Bacilli bacterium]